MADDIEIQGSEEPLHRGRVQAQGGGTEKSEAWARETPPTESEMLENCDRLENKLTAREMRERKQPFADVRRFIQVAAKSGGISANPS